MISLPWTLQIYTVDNGTLERVAHGEVFFLARQDGRLDVWDYFYRMNEVRYMALPGSSRIQQDPAGSAK